jgi:hypothetical protein
LLSLLTPLPRPVSLLLLPPPPPLLLPLPPPLLADVLLFGTRSH